MFAIEKYYRMQMRCENDSTSRQILRTALTDSFERSSSELSSIRRSSAFGLKKDRVVHIDPGLLTNEQLLEAQGGRRRTLERLLIEPGALNEKPRAVFKEKGRWFLDSAHIKISVSFENKRHHNFFCYRY